MTYKVVKGAKQLSIEGKEVDDKIFLPLDALWSDYTILDDNKIIFLDSPISNLEVGLVDISMENNSHSCLEQVKKLLTGVGCKVHLFKETNSFPDTVNIVIVINSAEGVFQTGYGGYILNGSKKLAADIGWAMAKIFELNYVSPPKKETDNNSSLSFWKKITTPLITINYRKGENHDLLLAVTIILGLFRFATKTLPTIDETIFLNKKTISPHFEEKNDNSIPTTDSTISVSRNNKHNLEEDTAAISEEIEDNPDHNSTEELSPKKVTEKNKILKTLLSNQEEEYFMVRGDKSKGSRGKLVTDPSPKLKAHMKKIIAQQHAKFEKENKAPSNKGTEYAAKLAGLGKG